MSNARAIIKQGKELLIRVVLGGGGKNLNSGHTGQTNAEWGVSSFLREGGGEAEGRRHLIWGVRKKGTETELTNDKMEEKIGNHRRISSKRSAKGVNHGRARAEKSPTGVQKGL